MAAAGPERPKEWTRMQKIFLGLATLAFLVGCEQPPPANEAGRGPTSKAATASASSAPASTTTAHSGLPANDPSVAVLTGRIRMRGTAPPPRRIQVTKDPEICRAAGRAVEDVILGKDAGVVDVVVEVQGIEPASGALWKWNATETGYEIHQRDCGFSPAMLVIPNGADLRVYNDDPVAHNVNTGAWNEMQPAGASPIVKPVSGRSPIKIGCNIHNWMEGWIYPAQSPLYAITDADGMYRIEGIPAGRYRVSVWHPYLGKKRERLQFEAGTVTTWDYAYEASE